MSKYRLWKGEKDQEGAGVHLGQGLYEPGWKPLSNKGTLSICSCTEGCRHQTALCLRFVSWAVFNLERTNIYGTSIPFWVKGATEQQVSSWHPSINFSITLSCAQTLECISCICFLWEGVTSTALAYLQYLMSKHFSSKRSAHKNVNPSFSNARKGAATLFTVSSPHQHPPPPTVLNSLEIFKENPQKGAYLERGSTVASWACPLLVLTFTTLYNYTKAFLTRLKAQKALYCNSLTCVTRLYNCLLCTIYWWKKTSKLLVLIDAKHILQ